MKRIFIIAAVVAVAIYGVYKYVDKNQTQDSLNTPVGSSESSSSEHEEPSLPFIDLQPTLDAWAAQQSGIYSVVIYDLSSRKPAGTLNPDKQYFTASIYKLYVAYEGYQKVADGTYKMEDPYLSGYNRGKCLDEMIRSSYSPCGEKMWTELGKEELTTKLKTYGLKNTSMVGLNTSASDAAAVLKRLHERRDLSEAHAKALLDSMKIQDATYRRGLPSGFASSTVYNKVGWNEQKEWHDTSIVTLPSGRELVVSVFTEGVGYRQITALGQLIQARMTQ